ncbi:MAG TPA: redoxin domain-containing protein [Saprospiraceae bacterium]|nr:redoxin domain-containing protein [Saprospiraceae bacterium]
MKKFLHTFFMICMVSTLTIAQKAINFSAKDIDGKDHNLYADNLNKGKIVVTFLMVADFEPCNVIAPRIQSLYEKFGSGNGNVQFYYFTVSPTDTIQALKKFRQQHGITAPIIGPEGGGLSASIQFTNGRFGPYQYVPQMNIILPDGSVLYDIVISRLEERINDALTSRNTMPNKVNISYSIPNTLNTSLPSKSAFYLRSAQDLSYKKNITELTKGAATFEYPSPLFPLVQEPYISFESTEPTPRGMVNVSDLVVLRIEDLSADALIAADINNDGRITLSDIVDMQRFILGIDKTWQNRPALIMHPSTLSFTLSGTAQTITLQPKLIWVGNLVD